MTGKEAPNKSNVQKFVRYAEGAKMYSMGLSKFQELLKLQVMQINGLRNSIRLFFLERRVRMGVVQKKFSRRHKGC